MYIQCVLTYIVPTGVAQQETQEHYNVAENVGEYMVKKPVNNSYVAQARNVISVLCSYSKPSTEQKQLQGHPSFSCLLVYYLCIVTSGCCTEAIN